MAGIRATGRLEKEPRIDSFDLKEIQGYGTLFTDGGGKMQFFDCEHYTDYGPRLEDDREIVEVWHPKDGWSRELELSRKENGFGGNQAFFLCPACGERRRYLYQVGATFLCRKCSRLNYRSQQETRSDCMYYYDKGVALVEKHLDTWPRVRPDGFSFCRWIPERPRYMHQTTYRRYLQRLAKYQDKHQRRELEDIARLLRIFK